MAKRLKVIVTALLLVGAARGQAILAAVPSSDALKASILKAKLLDPNIELITSADPEHSDYVLVSTFLHESATDSDCKIDALLIAKTVMELAGADVTRVTVSFFSSKDLSTYKQISVKSIEIKAFQAGGVGKDELLKNLEVKVGQTADSPANLTALMRQASLVKALQVAVSGKELNLSAQVDLSRGELDTKLAALQLAQNALAAAPEGVSKLTVKLQDFYEPSRVKLVRFDVAQLQSMASQLQTALSSMAIVATAHDDMVAGPFQEDRQKLFTRIKALEKSGVGVQAFFGFLKTIESSVGKDNLSVLQGNIKHLQDAVDEQEKTSAAIKNRPSQLKKEAEKEKEFVPLKSVSGDKHADFHTLGDMEFDDNRAHSDPNGYGNELASHYLSKQPVAPIKAQHLADGLQKISQLLRQDGNTSGADHFQQWASKIRTQYNVR